MHVLLCHANFLGIFKSVVKNKQTKFTQIKKPGIACTFKFSYKISLVTPHNFSSYEFSPLHIVRCNAAKLWFWSPTSVFGWRNCRGRHRYLTNAVIWRSHYILMDLLSELTGVQSSWSLPWSGSCSPEWRCFEHLSTHSHLHGRSAGKRRSWPGSFFALAAS